MKYRTVDTQPAAEHPDPACCNRAVLLWATDDILLATIDGRPIPTDAVNDLPPWRARMVVQIALAAGGRLEHGNPALFEQAAVAAGYSNNHAAGWWREALGLPRIEPRAIQPAPPRNTSPSVPHGWTLKQD